MSEEKNRNEELRRRITEAVEEFACNDQAFTDLAMLCIDPSTLEVTIADEPDTETIDADEAHDYVAIMDLVDADPANPGQWIADTEAIASLAEEY